DFVRGTLTRESDTWMSLRERVAKAEQVKADLFLSIHADSHPDPEVRGASIYTLSEEASDREAAALAARENGGPMNLPSGGVARPLVAMAQRGTGNDSRKFADGVATPFAKSGLRLLPRSHREAGFAVLTSPDIPAALVELGYFRNLQECRLLPVRHHQMALARPLRAPIDSYFASIGPVKKA